MPVRCGGRLIPNRSAMPSHVIRSFEYDAANRALLIVFQSGRRYVYQDVPEELYEAMRAAFSKGEFFNAHIREHFRFVRVAEAPGPKRR
jgi:KTSC domain